MHDLQEATNQLVTVAKARDLFPTRPDPSTIWRWIMKGTRGVKLRSVIVGGRRFIAPADVDRFLAELNDGATPATADDRSIKLANAALEAAGF